MEVAGIDRDTFYNIVVLFTETKIFMLHAHDSFYSLTLSNYRQLQKFRNLIFLNCCASLRLLMSFYHTIQNSLNESSYTKLVQINFVKFFGSVSVTIVPFQPNLILVIECRFYLYGTPFMPSSLARRH